MLPAYAAAALTVCTGMALISLDFLEGPQHWGMILRTEAPPSPSPDCPPTFAGPSETKMEPTEVHLRSRSPRSNRA